MAALTVDFRKYSGPTPADDMAAQIITDCGNFTLDFKQHGFCASPLFLQTLGPWFPNEMQNLLSSEKRTLDHWAIVQLFFSTAQVRCFWRCLWFRSGLVVVLLSSTKIMTKYRRQRTFITWRKRDETQRKWWSCDDDDN